MLDAFAEIATGIGAYINIEFLFVWRFNVFTWLDFWVFGVCCFFEFDP